MRYFFWSFLCLSLFSNPMFAQVGITAFNFLQINNDARSVGLSDSDASKLYSTNAFQLNPALLGSAENAVQIFGQFNNESGLEFGTIWAPALNFGMRLNSPKIIVQYGKFAFGYEHTYLDFGRQEISTGVDPEIIDSFEAYDFSHSLVGAYSINEFFRIGLGLNYNKSALYDVEIKGFSFDLGVYSQYQLEFDELTLTPTLGLSITDIGQPVTPEFEDSGFQINDIQSDDNSNIIVSSRAVSAEPIPTIFRSSAGLDFEVNETIFGLTPLRIAMYATASKIMARRDENGEPYKPFRAIFGTWNTYTRFNGVRDIELSLKDQFRTHTGFEIAVLEIISLRFGHYYEHPENGDRVYDTFGFGIGYKYFSLDFTEIDPIESSHPLSGTKMYQFSLNIPLSLINSWK